MEPALHPVNVQAKEVLPAGIVQLGKNILINNNNN